jgi:hypothetical protein
MHEDAANSVLSNSTVFIFAAIDLKRGTDWFAVLSLK